MAVTLWCREKYASLLLCCRTSQLRSVWLILPAQNGKATTGSTSEVYEKGTYNEASTRLLERYWVGHVYRDNFNAIWKRQTVAYMHRNSGGL